MMTVKESEKAGLKLNIQRTKITASGPTTSWQIEGEKVEAVTDFIFLDFKITVEGDCSHEIKRHLLLGRTSMTNLGSVLKSRDITLPTKIHMVKAMVFPVGKPGFAYILDGTSKGLYGCESCAMKKAEHHRIDAFKLWCWRRPLRVPWNARILNQSILQKSVLNILWKD